MFNLILYTLLGLLAFFLLYSFTGDTKFPLRYYVITVVIFAVFFAYMPTLFQSYNQYSEVPSTTVDIIRVGNITDHSATIIYTLDNQVRSYEFHGNLTVVPSAKKATATCVVFEDVLGDAQAYLKDIVIPEGFIN